MADQNINVFLIYILQNFEPQEENTRGEQKKERILKCLQE
jgi:hypothetical protein